MRLTVQNLQNDQVFMVEVEDSATVEDLKVMISVETNMGIEEQVLLANGKLLDSDSKKVSQYGV
jgi:hypothetical protein